jgi:hypothetical protein
MADDEQYNPQRLTVKHRWRKFNFAEWRSDPCLALCSRAARSLWLDLCGLIYEADDRGRLSRDGRPWTAAELATVLGDDPRTIRALLAELQRAGVYTLEDGHVKSRRIHRERDRSELRALSGSIGGRKTKQNWAEAEKVLQHLPQPKKPETRTTVASIGEATAAKAAKEASPLAADREFIWNVGKGLLTEAGATTAEAGALIGALVKRRGLAEAKTLVLSMRANPPVDVRSYVAAILHGRKPVQPVDDEPAHPVWTVDRDEVTGKLVKRRRI